MVRRCGRLLKRVSVLAIMVCAKILLDIFVKDRYPIPSDRTVNRVNFPARGPVSSSGDHQAGNEPRINATRAFTRLKYGPVFVLGVVGGNSSVNSTWGHFRIYGMLDKTVYKNETIRCCLMYREKDQIITLQSETISERRFVHPADMWSFHVGCPNVKHAQGHIPVGLSIILPSNVTCTENHVTYIEPYFPVNEPEKIVIGSKLAYGNISAEFIIEWIEAMKYIGVDKIVTYYLRTLNTDARNVLLHYASEGIVDLYFHEPANEDIYPRVDTFKFRVAQRWNDQSTIVFDTFERESGCRYFAIIDQDEFFIPEKYRTLREMFDHIEQNHTQHAGFLLRSQYYFLSWGKRSNKSELILRSYTMREGLAPRFDRRKKFEIPARIALGSTGTHSIVPKKGFKVYSMPTEQGYIRHFRNDCRPKHYNECMTNTSRILDTEVSDWAKGFSNNVKMVRKLILGL